MTKIMLIKDRNTFNTKWVCNFASQLIENGYEVTLVSDSYSKFGQAVPIDDRVKKINLSQKSHCLLINLWIKFRALLPVEFLRYKKLLNI